MVKGYIIYVFKYLPAFIKLR